MNRYKKIILIATPFTLIAFPFVAFFAALTLTMGVSNSGSPALAAEWCNDLAEYSRPAEAAADNSEIEHIKFPNGDWLIGRSRNSHGLWRRGGGTVVIRDSRGDTRVFFGHVCGEKILTWAFGEHSDLSSFYRSVKEHEFTEHHLP